MMGSFAGLFVRYIRVEDRVEGGWVWLVPFFTSVLRTSFK